METFQILEVTAVFASPFVQFRKKHIAPAFKELRRHGFHATTENIQCCQTCSLGVIPDNVSYVFYHAQDVDRFNEMNTLCLGYGFSDDHDRDICLRVLRRHMRIEWDGSDARRIQVWARSRRCS